MKLSADTITILKHFARVRPDLSINAGHILKTRSEALYLEARVTENFPTAFGICDLNDFLRTIAWFTEPTLEFASEQVRITEAESTAEVIYLSAKHDSLPRVPPRRDLPPPDEKITFTITADQWSKVQKALGLGQKKVNRQAAFLSIMSDGRTVRVGTQSHPWHRSNGYSLTIGGANPPGQECEMVFYTQNVPTMGGSYQVTVTPQYTEFRHVSGYDLYYIFAPEPHLSSWGGKQNFRIEVRNSVVQDCFVQARTAEEAKALVGQIPGEEFQWITEPRSQRDYRVIEP